MKKLLLTLLILLYFIIPTITYAEQKKAEPQIVISNVLANSFAVTWFTDEKVNQSVLYGKSEPLTNWAVDDRGVGNERNSHFVTIKNLEPNTEYFFRIGTAGTVYKQKTAPQLTNQFARLPERFRGKVLTEDKTVPTEGIVFMQIEGAHMRATPIQPDGSWEIKTYNLRSKDLLQYFKILETNYVDLFVRTGFEGEDMKKIFAYAREKEINFELQEPRVPFFKMQFPSEIFISPEVVRTATDTAQKVETASNENVFQIMWKRIREIF